MAKSSKEIAVLGGGCFWCLEAAFSAIKGVLTVTSGYSGGQAVNPSYEQVCLGKTGHAEVVKIEYNPNLLSFSQLLEVFFTIHDPTQLNRQGNDVGSQYRSVIFYQDETQQELATQMMRELNGKQIWDDPIVTELSEGKIFYPAESHHQNYFKNNQQAGYCQVVISPKLQKVRQRHKELWRT